MQFSRISKIKELPDFCGYHFLFKTFVKIEFSTKYFNDLIHLKKAVLSIKMTLKFRKGRTLS